MPKSLSNLTSRGHRLHLDLHGEHLPADAPVLIYLHGFKGFKEWGFVPWMAEQFVSAGIRFLAFNFTHNGHGASGDEVSKPDRFRDNTFSLELEEAQEVIQWVARGELLGNPVGTRIGLLGHSRGGGIAVLAASGNADVQCVCTWAAVSTFKRYPEEVIDRWRQQGFLEVTNVRTGQVLQLGWNLHADLLAHLHGKLNIQHAVTAMSQPLCIVHGDQDEAVDFVDAQNLFSWAEGSAAELHRIEGAGHTFGARHLFAGSTPHLDKAMAHTLAFFRGQWLLP